MASIEQISLPAAAAANALWDALAVEAQGWLARKALSPRDAIVLLPFAALLAPARAALARRRGWQPRVETARTLAAALGPPPAPTIGACSGDPTLDRLGAAALLRGMPWGAAWERRDRRGFGRIVADVVEAAQALRSAAFERTPALREAFWAEVRMHDVAAAGPASTESALLRMAVEWAAVASEAATDRLFQYRPSAWIVLRLGGSDPIAEALLGEREIPSLHLLADPPQQDPFGPAAAVASTGGGVRLTRQRCADFEAEAQASAAAVVEALNAGRTPVAVVALDRELLRRVRALLARTQVPLLDETGWLLDTTRAAADVVAMLRAALPDAGPDARLEWLKALPGVAAIDLDGLEGLWRGRRHLQRRTETQALWRRAQDHLVPLQTEGRISLAAWLRALRACLERSGSLPGLAADAAGKQLLAALGLDPEPAWRALTESWRTDLVGFIHWVESTLAQAPFLPPPDAGAQVVLTPLTRAFGRPFCQVVIAAADERHLGRIEPPPSLLGDALAARLGLDHAAARRQRQRLALAQLLRVPHLALLRRQRDGDEPVAESPDVEWLLLARERAGAPPVQLHDWRPAEVELPLQPVPRPQPRAWAMLPAVINASQLEALRECPYRFFARAVLRLEAPEELEAALVKRDYGIWLHAVLHRFHSQRDPQLPDAEQLHQAADAVTLALGLDGAELLPFRASFDSFVPAYLAWLALREARGWRWQGGEIDHLRALPELGGLQLRGRIDRIDHGPGAATELLDYKTGSAQALAQRVRQPLEDTQLAFYAALLGGAEELSAAYLALDDADAPREIGHPAVHRSAAALLQGLAGEWQRLQQGAPMPALGEGTVCETCECRGLCRRDHWCAT